MNMTKIEESRLAIIGLGYIGPPLVVGFDRVFPTVGFDINETRIEELKRGTDHTKEATHKKLRAAKHLNYTAKLDDLHDANVF